MRKHTVALLSSTARTREGGNHGPRQNVVTKEGDVLAALHQSVDHVRVSNQSSDNVLEDDAWVGVRDFGDFAARLFDVCGSDFVQLFADSCIHLLVQLSECRLHSCFDLPLIVDGETCRSVELFEKVPNFVDYTWILSSE